MKHFSVIRSFIDDPDLYPAAAVLTLVINIITLVFPTSSLAQKDLPGVSEWKDIAAKFDAGVLHDTVYMLKAQALTEKSFKDPALKEKLSLYHKIAWSDTSYQPFRIKYFAFLANQANQIHQEGFAIYYLEKMEEELKKKKPYINSLNQPRLLLSIYGENEHTNQLKRIAIIDSIMPYLKFLPKIISRQTVSINTCINAFTILKHASQLYLIRKDTAKVLEVLNLSTEIWSALESKKGIDKGKLEQCRYALFLTECAGARILSEPEKERAILNAAYRNIESQGSHIIPLFKKPLERTILGRLIDYHIDRKQLDSVNYYFTQFKHKTASYEKNDAGDGTKFLLYSGRVHALNNNYEAAYHDILDAYETNDSIISIKMADVHNNLYANLVAEQRNEALVTSEREKANRNLVIFIIVFVLLVTIYLFVWELRSRSKKANKQIEELNRMTQIQIAELESTANLIQKRMGMELHDDIAGRLVNICNFIETKAFDEKDPEGRELLATIGKMAKEAYTNTRQKSHEWYFKGVEEERTLFSQQVSEIVDQALPDGKYEKQIEIDDYSLKQVSPEMRIHFLRIIQEAVANILKHARANKVKLFLYEEEGAIALQITDNGKGFNPTHKSKGFGLESLRNRVNEMRGSFDITSSGEGTELLFAIPYRTENFPG
jgi:signal transduction histidine kinase